MSKHMKKFITYTHAAPEVMMCATHGLAYEVRLGCVMCRRVKEYRCRETMGSRTCLHSTINHPSFQGVPEHYDGRVWWM